MKQQDKPEKTIKFNALLWGYGGFLFIGYMLYHSMQSNLERAFISVMFITITIVSLPTVISFVTSLAISKVPKRQIDKNKMTYVEKKIFEGVYFPEEKAKIKEKPIVSKCQAEKTTVSINSYVKKSKSPTITDESYVNLRAYLIACSKHKIFTRESIIMLKREIDILLEEDIIYYAHYKFENDMNEIYVKIKHSKFTTEMWQYLLDWCNDNIELPTEEVG